MRALHKVEISSSQTSKWHTETYTHTTFWAFFFFFLQKTAHLVESLFSTTSPVIPSYLFSGTWTTMRELQTLRTSHWAGLKVSSPEQSGPLPTQSSKGLCVAQRTSGIQARPNLISYARLARCCYVELVFWRELEGNCIDILLLACLHKQHLA